MRRMPSLVALAVLATIGGLQYSLPDLPFDLPITSEPVAAGASITGRASIIDGDTIEIHGERIRILDIDAPESDQICFRMDDNIANNHWRCGQWAAHALSEWIGQQTVSCETTRKDKYRRWLARCAVAGKDVAGWLASAGWAVPYRDCKCEVIRDAAKAAKAANLGIWAGTFIMPWHWRAQ